MASSSDWGMFVAKMCRMRYFGGGFGFMPSNRRRCRFTNPRGFFRPDISDSSACSVPIPPPPPMPPMMIGSLAAPISERTTVSRVAGVT